MSTKPVRLLNRSQLLGCAFILQAAAISACATEADPGESAPTGMTTTPAQTGAGAPAASAAGAAARAGSPATATAGRPASGAAGTPSTAPASGAAGSAGAKATGAAGSEAGAAGSAAAGSGAAGSSSGAAGASSSTAGSSGGAAGGGAATGGVTFTKVFDAMFASSAAAGCGSCHGAPANPSLNGGLGGLMTKEAAHTALVGKMSSSSMCSGETYVTAGDPEGSLLYQKVAAAPMCGMRMPPGGMVDAVSVELLKGWIMGGAKND
jgi:hypothetical protein